MSFEGPQESRRAFDPLLDEIIRRPGDTETTSQADTDFGQFEDSLRRSGLVEAAKLNKAIGQVKERGKTEADARQLAHHLLQQGLLTQWQNDQLSSGTYRGFFLGKYKLLDVLGTGGMSTVYLAEHVIMFRRVALKVLLPHLVKDELFVDRFYREARASARLDHPNIVKVHDIADEGDVHYIVMEYVQGKNLRKLVDEQGKLPFAAAVKYIRQAALALAHAHQNNIIHRDIKPENLVVDAASGQLKILDLGLARLGEAEDRLITVSDNMLGTVDYMAPEQAEDSHEVDARADIYSLGCTLYFLIAGQPPFPNGTAAQRLMFHMLKTPTALREIRPDTPQPLVEITERMLAKQPGDRFQSADELVAAIDRCLPEYVETEPEQASSPAATTPPSPQVKSPTAVKVEVAEPDSEVSIERPTPPQAEDPDSEVSIERPALPAAAEDSDSEISIERPTPQAPQPQKKVAQPQPQPAAQARAKPVSVRVTLRRVLAYCAGALQPEIAAAISAKFQQSSMLRDIVDRVAKVVTWEWLDAPDLFDPNAPMTDVASYLDNTIAASDRQSYEWLCLEGDLYLAECAACYACLTQFLQRPAGLDVSPATRRQILALASPQRPQVEMLAAGLTDRDGFIRQLAVEGLGNIGPAAALVEDQIEAALRDRDMHVRQAARNALAKIQSATA